MQQLSQFPYTELVLGKNAEVVDRTGFDELLGEVTNGEPVDVLVFAHGWNNNIEDARRLYAGLVAQLRSVLDTAPPAQLGERQFAILGVLWPSKRFTDQALIPGGAAGTGASARDAELQARLDQLKGVFDADDADDRLSQAKALVPRLEESPAARDQFVDLLRGAVADLEGADGDDFSDEYRTLRGRDALERLKAPVLSRRPPQGPSTGGAAGGAEGGAAGRDTADDGGAARGLSLSGITTAGERFLNLTTYYQMKQRAGLVGANGLNPRLRDLRQRSSTVRLHLVGHSFGGRLVTAATVGAPGAPAVEPDTVTLLQAAFSHYGFAQNYEPGKDGFFRRMVSDRMTRGPIVVTHSAKDTAVGYAYPMASRLAGFAAAGLGDADDRFGGIGRNGAQKTPEAIAGGLQDPGQPYSFESQHVYNLNADSVILDHSAICIPQVAYAILSAVAASSRSGSTG
jgi:pimeloyl-ACP methyl ester carboxylesterase